MQTKTKTITTTKTERYWTDYWQSLDKWNQTVVKALRQARTPEDTKFWISMFL